MSVCISSLYLLINCQCLLRMTTVFGGMHDYKVFKNYTVVRNQFDFE
jgi:hypothetical protein